MNLEINDQVVATFKDKDSKKPQYRELYERLPFLEAYSRHTDMRMALDPHGAIGRADEWESHGKLQLEFLISRGLKPEHRFLDIGCGPGRLARRVVPYLEPGRYVGADISQRALEYAVQLAQREGWLERRPDFFCTGDLSLGRTFDFAWAHSVFTHLPPHHIDAMVASLAEQLAPGAPFYFTFKRADKIQRSGLKQFQYRFEDLAAIARLHGLEPAQDPMQFPAGQQTGCMRQPA